MKLSRLLLCCLLPLILLLLAGCGGGGGGIQGFADVQGNVFFPGNAPVEQALVRVHGTSNSTRTDTQGHYLLRNIPAGPCTLVVSYIGYQSVSVTANVVPGAIITVADCILQPAARKWTVLVYLDADNNLEPFGVADVNEMEAVPDSSQVTTVVQMDRAVGFDTTNDNWQDTRRFVIQQDANLDHMTSSENPVELMGEVDMGKPSTLQDFIAWGKKNYPAEHYLLIVWDHGTGWRGSGRASGTRGVAYDDTSGSHIRTVDLAAATASIPPLDIISFDTCLMQMLEVAYELRNSASYITASEENTPDTGYKYDAWLGPLVQNPAMSPLELGTTMGQSMVNVYGVNGDITHSVLDTAQLDNLTAAVDALGAALIEKPAYAQQNVDSRVWADHYAYSYYKDLYDYARLLAINVPDTQVRNAANVVMAAVQATVVAEFHGSLHANAHGISIWVPDPTAYRRDSVTYGYLNLGLAKASRWDEWLASQSL